MGGGWRAAVPALLAVVLWSRGLPAEEVSCPEGTYRNPSEPRSCLPCDVCDGGRSYEQHCTANANAVCRCPPGRECGGNSCVPCECAVGQQHTGAGCKSCPEGEFNDRRTGPCRPWRRCPGGRILTSGTKERDVVCRPELPPTSTSPLSLGIIPTKMTEMAGQLVLVAAATAALSLCLLVLLLFCLFRVWSQGKSQEGPRGQPAQEVDDSSYCYPEEEEGGGGSEAPGLKGELLLEKIP